MYRGAAMRTCLQAFIFLHPLPVVAMFFTVAIRKTRRFILPAVAVFRRKNKNKITMTDTVFSAIIGGLSGSTVTFFGNYFFPIWQENRKKKKREKEILRPRRERLLNLLK